MNHFVSRLVGIVLVVVCLLVFADRASAANRPYKASGTARLDGLDISGQGNAAHLGHYVESGIITSVIPISDTLLALTANITYTTDDGVELHATATGTLDLGTGILTASLTYEGGTGRFANASGSANLSGQMLEDGEIVVTVKGKINY